MSGICCGLLCKLNSNTVSNWTCELVKRFVINKTQNMLLDVLKCILMKELVFNFKVLYSEILLASLIFEVHLNLRTETR